MDNLSVVFGTITKTKTRQAWVKELVKDTLEKCQDDGAYCDNTVNDFYLYGFKGIENMTDAELLVEVKTNLEYKYDPNY